jgi:hypothetical protein
MPLYFLVIEGELFHEQLRPALAEAWRWRSFAPCRSVCLALMPAVAAARERYHLTESEPFLAEVARRVPPYHRHRWHHLAGELLWYSAVDTPLVETSPDSLARLAGQTMEQPERREQASPLFHLHYGARDLAFGGGYYRPDQAGYNDAGDVARLAAHLRAIQSETWDPASLTGLPGMETEEERVEETAFVRDWFPALVALYEQARAAGHIVVCEQF